MSVDPETKLAGIIQAHSLIHEYCLVLVSRLIADREGDTADNVLRDLEASMLRAQSRAWSRDATDEELARVITEAKAVITKTMAGARDRLNP